MTDNQIALQKAVAKATGKEYEPDIPEHAKIKIAMSIDKEERRNKLPILKLSRKKKKEISRAKQEISMLHSHKKNAMLMAHMDR